MTNVLSFFNGSSLAQTSLVRGTVARLQAEERGQNLVEMALVLLFLLPLTFGIIDFSRCIYTASVVNAAAQEGARAGIIDESGIMGAIQSKMIGLNMASTNVDIDSSHPDIIEVNIAYDYRFITPMIDGFVDGVELTGTASMVKQ